MFRLAQEQAIQFVITNLPANVFETETALATPTSGTGS